MNQELANLKQALQEARNSVDVQAGELFRVSAAHANAANSLGAEVATARADGRIEGKNEADRDAHARQLFGDSFATVEELASELAEAKVNLDRARNRLDMLRDEIRLWEINVGLSRAA